MKSWKISLLKGSDVWSHEGIVGTEQNPAGHPLDPYSGETTIVVGSPVENGEVEVDSTKATWRIPLMLKSVMDFDEGFLFTACKRKFGGLHSILRGGRVDVKLNGNNIDSFGLRENPRGHSDFFHRPDLSERFPSIAPLNRCDTLYAWNIWKERLQFEPYQELKIEIGETVCWDIDYTGIVYKTNPSRPTVFISHNHRDQSVARNIAQDLDAVGIKSWIDEGEIQLGDSIIEKISDGLDTVEHLIALISKNSIGSNWVKKELSIAMAREINSRKIKVIPLVLDDVEIPTYLSDKLCGDIKTSSDYVSTMNKIVTQMQAPR